MSEQRPPASGPAGPAPSADAPPADPSPPTTSAPPSALSAPPTTPRRPRRSRGVVALVLTTWVLALVLGLGGGLAGVALWERFGGTSAAPPAPRAPLGTDQRPAPQPAPGSVAAVAAEVLPSVVTVEVETAQGGGSGSGFVVDASGLLLTNNHVVDGAVADGVSVVLSDGTSLPAEVVGRTVRYDLAVLRVDRAGLAPLRFASTALSVGDPVVAVGAPLGLQSTVTTGIVSALDRPVTAGEQASSASYMNAVQTDAAINPGNSGGPLVDLNGDVVGINSAIATAPSSMGGQGGSIGLGFAIPAAQASRTAQEIIDTGRATYPVVGVVLENDYTGPGVQITRSTAGGPPVTPGGPADQAGLEPGDVILAFDGTPVRENAELIVAIGAQRPGDTATLSVAVRGGDPREVTLELDASEED